MAWPEKAPKQDGRNAPAVQEFKKAEGEFQQKVDQAGSMTEYLKAHPRQQMVFSILSLLIAFSLTCGLFIDFLILFRPRWRADFSSPAPPPPAFEWKFSMIFKVALLFISISYLLGAVLGFIRRYFLPDGSMNFSMLLHTSIMDALCLFFVLHVVRKEGGNVRDVGFRIPSGSVLKEVSAGWAAYAAILPVFGLCLGALVAIAQFFHYEPDPHPLVNVFLEEEKRSSFIIFFSIFLATFYGPIFEEIFFRGLCYPIFKHRFGVFPAMVVSAAFFAIIHANTFAFWPIFILGLGLAWVYEKRGSLLPGIILHVTHNTVFITYFFLAKKIVQHAAS